MQPEEDTIVVGDAPVVQSFKEIISIPSIIDRIHALGMTTPTPVQAQAVPYALQGGDLIVQAKTGSGKTITFCIPLLAHLYGTSDTKHTACLVVTPTRELANQVHTVLESLGVFSVSLIGGMKLGAQLQAVRKDARVIVGTPGRILDLIRQRAINLESCRFVALDEADEMLSMGFYEDVTSILSMLPKTKQGMFVSATISDRVVALAQRYLTRPKTIVVQNSVEETGTIEHLYCEVPGDLMAKPNALCEILKNENPRLGIIFCNSKSDTELVEVVLKRRGFNALKINSDLSQKERNSVIEKMRNEHIQYLVGTDIAARGLDIDQVELVVNYALHEHSEIYVHRTGRTGRAGRSGKAISLIGPQDFMAFINLKRTVNPPLTKIETPSAEAQTP